MKITGLYEYEDYIPEPDSCNSYMKSTLNSYDAHVTQCAMCETASSDKISEDADGQKSSPNTENDAYKNWRWAN